MDGTTSTTNPPPPPQAEAEEEFYEAETDTTTATAATTAAAAATSAEEEFLQEAAALLPGELVDKMTLLEHHVPGGEEEEEEGGGQNAVHAQEMKEKGNELYQAQDFEGALDCYSRAIKACPYQYDKEKELAAARRKMLLRREDEEAAEAEERRKNNNESTKAAAAGAPEEAAAGGVAADDESNDKGKENVDADAATAVATKKEEAAEPEPEPEPEEPFAEYKEDCAVYYCNRAACLVALKRPDEEVVENCTIALKLKPGYLKALLRRAQASERLDKLEDTLKDYKEVLEVDPTNRLARSKIPGLEKECAVRMEKLKDETLGKLKELGNSVLSNFGLSLDNFKMQQDPNTGSYSISFQN